LNFIGIPDFCESFILLLIWKKDIGFLDLFAISDLIVLINIQITFIDSLIIVNNDYYSFLDKGKP
jgi:hypothetical protein